MTHEKNTTAWERMLPREFRAAQEALPVCYLPLGTVEWHGEHNALGLDAVKAHTLCLRAAALAGGIVHPPLYGGMGGLDMPATVVMEPELTWDNHLLRTWLEKLCMEVHRQGFKGIILLTGHYGHNQQLVIRETGARMTERLDIPVIGNPEYWLAQDVGYTGDHAGIGETSILMHLHPELVDLPRIDSDPDYGPSGLIKAGTSDALGKLYCDTIVERLAAIAKSMPTWTQKDKADCVRAERAIVTAQVTAWRRTGDQWKAFKLQRKTHPELLQYGKHIADKNFAAIEAMAARLVQD
jgi:creatinine amidohydrolase